jgi:hypothetical protein
VKQSPENARTDAPPAAAVQVVVAETAFPRGRDGWSMNCGEGSTKGGRCRLTALYRELAAQVPGHAGEQDGGTN